MLRKEEKKKHKLKQTRHKKIENIITFVYMDKKNKNNKERKQNIIKKKAFNTQPPTIIHLKNLSN